jgi:VanZ family protein
MLPRRARYDFPLARYALVPRVRETFALVLGIASPTMFSVCAEVLQHFLPMRFPSIVDVVTNALGAWIGATIAITLLPWPAKHWLGITGWNARQFHRLIHEV